MRTMQRRNFFNKLGTGALATVIAMPLWAASGKEQAGPVNPAESIQHMVIFDLKHEKGSEAESRFLDDGKRILATGTTHASGAGHAAAARRSRSARRAA